MATQVTTTRYNPTELFQDHYEDLVEIISTHLLHVLNALYTKRLITRATKGEILITMSISDYAKASRLMHDIETGLTASPDPVRYLTEFCDVLKNQQPQTLKDIGASIIQQLHDAELIQPPQNQFGMNVHGGGPGAARNIISAPIAVDKVFEYTYNPVRPTFQQHLKYPPSEDVELITPSEAAARNITSAPVSIDKVFEYTHKEQGGSSFQDFLQHPPSEEGEPEIDKSLQEPEIDKSIPPEIKQVREYELPQIGIKNKVTMEDTSDDTSNEWINKPPQPAKRVVWRPTPSGLQTTKRGTPLPTGSKSLYKPPQNKVSMNVRGGGPVVLSILFDDGFLDPSFDHDFTNESDNGKVYIRGGEVYHRPYGWYRFALKVLNKYEDNTWLGDKGPRTASTPGEWPVSYHGTSKEGAEGIATEGYDINRGKRFLYGRGIYSSPDLYFIERYATKFSENGKQYKVVFQNRVNPDKLRKAFRDKYWIADDSDIRPYGILVKEIPIPVERAETSNNQQNTCTTS